MATGTVKWYDDSLGFGFIAPDEGGEDVFAHCSAIKAGASQTLISLQHVSYDLEPSPTGSVAANIVPA